MRSALGRVVSHLRCIWGGIEWSGRGSRERMRVISPKSVRIHLARSGTSMLRSFSTAREKQSSFVTTDSRSGQGSTGKQCGGKNLLMDT